MLFEKDRKWIRVALSMDLVRELITINYEIHGSFKCIKGIPEDAVFVCSTFHDADQISYLVFHHHSFDPVPIGGDIPIVTIGHEIL